MGSQSEFVKKNVLLAIFLLLVVLTMFYIYFISTNSEINIFLSSDNSPEVLSVGIYSEFDIEGSEIVGQCSVRDADFDDENLTCEYQWYLDGQQKFVGISDCFTNMDNNLSVISGDNLTFGEWIFSCRAYDNFNYSDFMNSSEQFIDSFPYAVFHEISTLALENSIILNISAVDIDVDTLVVSLSNESQELFFSSTGVNAFGNITNLSLGSYVLTVTVNDSRGHVNITSKTIYLDNTSPILILDHLALEYEEPVFLQIIAEDSISGVECISLSETSLYFNLSCEGILVNKTTIPPGIHWINISIVDFAGNNNSGSFYISVSTQRDITIPVISNLSVISLINKVVISWKTNEISNLRIFFGVNASNLNSTRYSSALVLAHAIELEGLFNNTLYYFNISSCDDAGNCGWILSNFTTLSQEEDSETENDNGDKSKIFSVGYNLLISGYDKQGIQSGDKLIISLSSSGNKQNITFLSISTSSVRMRVNNLPSFILNLGVNQSLDLTGDNVKDVDIVIVNITNGKLTIKLKLIPVLNSTLSNPSVIHSNLSDSVGIPKLNVPEIPSPDSAKEGEDILIYLIFGVVIVIFLLLVILWYIKYKTLNPFFKINSSKNLSNYYIHICELINQAEGLIAQGKKDNVFEIYNNIRTIYSFLSIQEKGIAKPKIIKLYLLIKQS